VGKLSHKHLRSCTWLSINLKKKGKKNRDRVAYRSAYLLPVSMEKKLSKTSFVYSQVISSLREAGLESSNLILGIDFTKSNEWTGDSSIPSRSI
jgi:hypothetical protein